MTTKTCKMSHHHDVCIIMLLVFLKHRNVLMSASVQCSYQYCLSLPVPEKHIQNNFFKCST